jgi:O-antigen ligase
MNAPRTVNEARVPAIALWSFLAFFLFSFFNISGLFTHYYEWESLPIQPVAFGAAFVTVIPWTRGKPFPAYFTAAWGFWAAFTIGGYLGAGREDKVLDYGLIQLILKQWISMVGVPLMTIRAINRDKLPMLGRLTTVAGAVGAVFAMIQTVYPAPFVKIVVERGRGAGFWINPNGCAEVCTLCMFISLIYPFQSKILNATMRLMLIIGTLATLSRGGVVLLVAGFVVYGIAGKRLRTVLKVGFLLAFVALIGTVLVSQLRSSTSKVAAKRLDRFSALMKGDISESKQDRLLLWRAGIDAVLRRDPIFGLGHRTMERIVPIGSGMGPHNYYIYLWGNSGLIGVLGFFVYLATLWRLSRRCTDALARPSLYAITTLIALTGLISHSFLNNLYYGPFFGIMACIFYHNRPLKGGVRSYPTYAPAGGVAH